MIKYLLLHVLLTMIFFMIWVTNTELTGGEVGMTPILLGIYLLIHLVVGAVLSLIFRIWLDSKRTRLIGILIYVLLYELAPVVSGMPMIFGIFEPESTGEVNRAFALIPLVSGVFVALAIYYNERRTRKSKSFANSD